MDVISGCDHYDLIFEEGKLLWADRSAVHQGLDTLLMWPAARNLEETCNIFLSVPPANLYWLWNLTGLFWSSREKNKSSEMENCDMED